MMVIKALSKQLFGAKYERVGKSLLTCLILFLAVNAAEMHLSIAPSVLFLTATAFSMGTMWQTLDSARNQEFLKGFFLLPFACGQMTLLVALAFSGYTLITKTSVLLALFFSVGKWSTAQIMTALLCACNGCLMAAAGYAMMGRQRRRPALWPVERKFCGAWPLLFWWGGMLCAIFLVRELPVFIVILSVSLLLSVLLLRAADDYAFYRPAAVRVPAIRSAGTGNVFLYLLRCLATNRSYLLNTAGLCGIAAALPFILGPLEGLNVLPLGFAILCMNTPLCVLLSRDPGLEQAVRMLPGQAGRFCIRYGLFLFLVHMGVSGVYLASWELGRGGVGGEEILAALLIAMQSAVLSVLLEWRFPIRGWKIESDLWHHPRKYIVPLLMMLAAGGMGIWPGSVWILGGILSAEIPGLWWAAGRM